MEESRRSNGTRRYTPLDADPFIGPLEKPFPNIIVYSDDAPRLHADDIRSMISNYAFKTWSNLLEEYYLQHNGVGLEVVKVLYLSKHVSETSYIGCFFRKAIWTHMNLIAKLKDDDAEKLYFAQTVEICYAFGPSLYRVLSLVPVHQNDPSAAQGNCEICTHPKYSVFHPSREFYTGDVSSLDPSHLPEWIQAGKALEHCCELGDAYASRKQAQLEAT